MYCKTLRCVNSFVTAADTLVKEKNILKLISKTLKKNGQLCISYPSHFGYFLCPKECLFLVNQNV